MFAQVPFVVVFSERRVPVGFNKNHVRLKKNQQHFNDFKIHIKTFNKQQVHIWSIRYTQFNAKPIWNRVCNNLWDLENSSPLLWTHAYVLNYVFYCMMMVYRDRNMKHALMNAIKVCCVWQQYISSINISLIDYPNNSWPGGSQQWKSFDMFHIACIGCIKCIKSNKCTLI